MGSFIGDSTQHVKVHQSSNNIRKKQRKEQEHLKLMSINVRGIKSKVTAISDMAPIYVVYLKLSSLRVKIST